MRLFTVGPVEMKKEILEVGGRQVPYFRTQEFSDMMLDSDRLLHKFMNAGKGAKSVYLTASGTGAMEATIINCLRITDRVLIINGGTFGHRFVELCEIHEIPHIVINLAPDERLTAKHMHEFDDKGITALLVNINETSVGQLYDIHMLAEFCERNHAYFIVDAISSFLIDQYDMLRYGVDATIISSQKGLCIAPGLSVVVLSNRMIKDRIENAPIKNIYFDFNSYIHNFTRGQTPFTPCVGICCEMNKALHMIEEEGLEHFLQGIDRVARDFRYRVQELPVHVPDLPLGNAVTPIIFEKNIAKKVFEILKNKYGIFVNPTGGLREEYVLRIAHIGNTTVEDNEKLIGFLKMAIAEAGV